MLLPLLLAANAAAVDGAAALEHARRLAALGPHPFGSTLSRVAADYVSSELTTAGLSEVHLQRFESEGLAGTNVVGTLRAPGPEFVVVAAHHDTAPASPGAYDDGGGVGILIEVARTLAREPVRPRTVVFVSFDGTERTDSSTGGAGARAYVKSIAHDADDLIGALVIEMGGWSGGTPCLNPLPYADPMRPSHFRITPGWLVESLLDGARSAGSPLCLLDPRLSWLVQPMMRTVRLSLGGDDGLFSQAHLPAAGVSESFASKPYPWLYQPADTADKLDARALARLGQAVYGATRAMERLPRGPVTDPTWFGAGERMWGDSVILGVGLISLLPGLRLAYRRGGFLFVIRLTCTIAIAVLLLRRPVPTVWFFALPGLLLPLSRGWWAKLIAVLPAAGVAGVAWMAWHKGLVAGLWWAPWELAIFGLAALTVWIVPRSPRKIGKGNRRKRGLSRR